MNAQSPTTPTEGKAPAVPTSPLGRLRRTASVISPSLLTHFPRRKALLAISGGRDSVALLHLLLNAGHKNFVLCHLNHGLRGRDSGQDAAFVRRLAQKHNLPCEIEKVDIANLSKSRHQSIETVARDERHAFLRRCATKHRTRLVFLAHHADDQAETILANLCRGTGLKGFAGMSPVTTLDNGITLLRPLLGINRQQIHAFVTENELPFREDASNTDSVHRRNRLRHEALPLLNAIFQRDTAPLITSAANLARRDADALDQIASTTPGVNEPELSITPELKNLHAAILSRVLRLWLTQTHGIPNVGRKEIDALMGMLSKDGIAAFNLPADRRVRRKAKRLRIERA